MRSKSVTVQMHKEKQVHWVINAWLDGIVHVHRKSYLEKLLSKHVFRRCKSNALVHTHTHASLILSYLTMKNINTTKSNRRSFVDKFRHPMQMTEGQKMKDKNPCERSGNDPQRRKKEERRS